VVAGERRRAVLRRAEPARLELLPAHVRETVDAEAVGEAPPVLYAVAQSTSCCSERETGFPVA
jgi:hypothetical protein